MPCGVVGLCVGGKIARFFELELLLFFFNFCLIDIFIIMKRNFCFFLESLIFFQSLDIKNLFGKVQ